MVAVEEELKRREITPDMFTEGMTIEELKKNVDETPYQVLKQKGLSFKAVRELFAAEYFWFGFALFGKPQVLTKIDNIIYRLNRELAVLKGAQDIIEELEQTALASAPK